MSHSIRFVLFALLISSVAACAKAPTQEECKAGITRMMEIQIDDMFAPGSAAFSAMGSFANEADRAMAAQRLKAGIPSLLTARFLAECVERVKRSDLECTMSAKTTDELIQMCHWKPTTGPKGAALGF